MISLKQKELIISNNIKEADLITHSGTFHSDDIFSTVILKNILDKECIKICRINDIEEEIDSIVYDIGGGKYDHHQPGGNGERENGIKYSSFGLIWKDFGKVFLEKDCIKINGGNFLNGGFVKGFADHRVVMAAFIISSFCKNFVFVSDVETIFKSNVKFLSDFKSLGGCYSGICLE